MQILISDPNSSFHNFFPLGKKKCVIIIFLSCFIKKHTQSYKQKKKNTGHALN